MSDVNVTTNWTSLSSSDTEYNTVVGVAGYDADNTRLFVSAQQTPNFARNVTTEYARGFSLNSGYDGITRHDAITETAADLKTVKFTMSMAGSAYDLTDARCYVQFKNHYTVDIASWALRAQAEDDTLTTIASGGTIAGGAAVQIDFKNDYNAARFIMTVTYSGEVTYNKFTKWTTNTPPITGQSNVFPIAGQDNAHSTSTGWININYTPCDMYLTAANNQPVLMTHDNNGYTRYYVIYEQPGWKDANRAFTAETNLWHYTMNSSSDWLYGSALNYCTNNGLAYSTLNDAKAAFNNPISGGLKTSDLDNYTGNMWQCRMIANVAAISPGPMATESQGGTDGDFDITTDTLTPPVMPSIPVGGTAKIWLIDNQAMSDFQSCIYTTNIVTALVNKFTSVADGIISIMQYPFPASAYQSATQQQQITVGNTPITDGTLSPMGLPLLRYTKVDCGTVDLHLFWDSCLDLNPYTKLSVYIPCVGYRPLNADVVMGHTIGLYYLVDLATGGALAVLTIDGDFLDQYPCDMATRFAIHGEQYGQLYQGILSTIATTGIGLATAGSGAAVAGTLANSANQMLSQKITRDTTGSMGSNNSIMCLRQPHIEIIRPVQALPRDYTHFNAYPSYMTAQLFNVSGWTEVQDIYLDDIDCTDNERSELDALLKSGVII